MNRLNLEHSIIKFEDMRRGQNWLNRLSEIIENSSVKYSLSNKEMACQLGISERDLFRKIKDLTNLSPQQFLRRFYLKEAMTFLQEGKFRTVKEVAYAIGYSNVSYFIIRFEKEFGKKPFQVLKESGWR